MSIKRTGTGYGVYSCEKLIWRKFEWEMEHINWSADEKIFEEFIDERLSAMNRTIE